MKAKQFFILGNPRSGTSLLRVLLNSHSLLSVAPECGFLLWLYPKYKKWNITYLNEKIVVEFVRDLQMSKKFETWQLNDKDIFDVIMKISPKNYEELAQCVYYSYAYKYLKNPLYLGDKNNYYIKYLDDLDFLYEDKIIIHLVRDGRDVATSYRAIAKLSNTLKYKPNLSYDIDSIALEWQTNNLNIFNHYRHNKNYILVKYEDLLTNSLDTLQDILSLFNLKVEEKMLDFYKENNIKSIEPIETLAWKLKTLEPIDKTNAGKYKNELTIEEIDLFNKIANESLKLFGYET